MALVKTDRVVLLANIDPILKPGQVIKISPFMRFLPFDYLVEKESFPRGYISPSVVDLYFNLHHMYSPNFRIHRVRSSYEKE